MLSAAYEMPAAHADCKRAEPRTNMFVMAKLVFSGTTNPVKIRNMSPSGALIEGPALPTEGMACCLSRADMELDANVVWVRANKVGLKFRQRAHIADWYPAARRTQSEVDAAVAQARAELASPVRATTAEASPQAPIMASALSADEVRATADALAALADDLADEPAVVARFMAKLQTLDIGVQTLRKLAAAMNQA